MFLDEVFLGKPVRQHPIVDECSQFLTESEGYPILKNLSKQYDDLHKVKIRQRKRKDNFTRTFNEAFEEVPNLRQRSLFANGYASFIAEDADTEPFFVFPIDGYKYKYSLEVQNSKEDYRDAFDVVLEQIQDEEVLKDLLKYTYTSTNLVEGIQHGSEIIFYNIPYYYAFRASSVYCYEDLLQDLGVAVPQPNAG